MKCKVCGKELPMYGRRSYCSDACAKEGNRIRARGFERSEYNLDEPIKCAYCGKDFVRKYREQKYCSFSCKKEGTKLFAKVKRTIREVARKYGFEVKNEERILRAKKIIFKNGDLCRCPCDAHNPNRYCGSKLCIHDTVHKGHCHCNMFHEKKTLHQLENGL